MTDYTPVSCELYARLELWIMHRESLRLAWRDEQGEHLATVHPLDLQTRDHQEFLLARVIDGGELELRLDRILRVQCLSGG